MGHDMMSTSLGRAEASMAAAPRPCGLSACTSGWARPARAPKVRGTPDGDATRAGRSGWSSATHQTPRRWLQGFSTSKEYTLLWLGAGALRAPGLGVAQDLAKRLVDRKSTRLNSSH